MLLVTVVFSFVNISQVIGWEGWVYCTSQEIGWEDRLWNNQWYVRHWTVLSWFIIDMAS